MNYKHIDIEDYQKTTENFIRERIRNKRLERAILHKRIIGDNFQGCLFVYDDLFKEEVGKVHFHWKL
jgi:hypothetical protein